MWFVCGIKNNNLKWLSLAITALSLASACVAKNPKSSEATDPPVNISSLELVSQDRTTSQLRAKGGVNLSGVTDLTLVELFSSAGCSDGKLASGNLGEFSSVGLTFSVPSSQSTPLYAKVQTSEECIFIVTYSPDTSPLKAPVLTSSVPSSPSRTSFTPAVFGTTESRVLRLEFFRDSSCSTLVGSGYASAFRSGGIGLTLTSGASILVHVKAYDPFDRSSNCFPLFTYTHATNGPDAPVFQFTNPPSPSKDSIEPLIRGTASADTETIQFFSDSGCQTTIGTGTRDEYQGLGIEILVGENSDTSIYAKAFDSQNRPSRCVFQTLYQHDSISPGIPTYDSLSPASPTRLTIYPKIKGTLPADASMIKFYSDSRCTVVIGSGPKTQYENQGITISGRSNEVVTIYGEALDPAGNKSACTSLSSFENDTIAPDVPVYGATNPISPNNFSVTPLVNGNASFDTVTVKIYNGDTCSTLVGEGTAETYNDTGIPIVVSANHNTELYATGTDAVGNVSACTSLITYMHSNLPAAIPSFVRSSPVSPMNNSTTPWVIGSAHLDVVQVKLFSDASCLTEVATGTRSTFVNSGIQFPLTANSVRSVYGKSIDKFGNDSACTFLTTLTHTNILPSAPSFTSTNPVSPNNSSFTPKFFGGVADNPSGIIQANTVSFYDSNFCVNRIGNGTVADYTGATGITVTVPNNGTTAVHAQTFDAAGNKSACTYLSDYTTDTLNPGIPLLSSASPNTPSYSRNTVMKGSIGASTDFLPVTKIHFYTDDSCSSELTEGTLAQWTGAGIPMTVPRNATTGLYGRAENLVHNFSACAPLIDFLHNDLGPTGLQTNQLPNGSVTLTWSPDQVARPTPSYRVKRSLTPNGPYTVIASGINGGSFTDLSVTEGETYYYVVQAINSTGSTLNSFEASITATSNAQSTPLNLIAVGESAKASLSWTGFTSTQFYKVYRATQSGGPYQFISRVSSASYVDNTVTNGSSYYYVVSGVNSAQETVQSNEARVTPRGVGNAPTGLSVTPVNDLGICPGVSGLGFVLTWNNPSHFNTIQISQSYTAGNFLLVSTTTGNRYVDCSPLFTANNSNPAHPNVFALRTVWGADQSDPSAYVTANNQGNPDLVVSPGDTSIELEWSIPSLSVAFDVQRSLNPPGPFTTIASDITDSFYSDSAVSSGVTYFYRIIPKFGTGTLGYPSLTQSGALAPNPNAPTNLNILIENSLPKLVWSAPDHYNNFNLYVASSAGGPWTHVASPTSTNYLDASPPYSRTYYRVSAQWGTHETTYTNVVSFRSGRPGAFAATGAASNVNLSWGSVAGASSYHLKRSTSSGGPYSTVNAAIAATTFNDSSVTPDQGYYYILSSNFADGTSSQPTSEVSATPGTSTIPSGITVTDTSTGSITLSWSRVNNATSYRLYQATSSGGPYTPVTPHPNVNSKTSGGLLAQTQYFYQITSIVSGAESARSPTISARTYSGPMAPMVTAGNSAVNIQWAPVSFSSSYDLLRSTDGTSFSSVANGITGASYVDNTVMNGSVYFYKIRANFATGESLLSTISSEVTPGNQPLAPGGITIIRNETGTELEVSWGNVPGATAYNVYANTNAGGPYTGAALMTSSSSNQILSNLTTDTTYYIAVTAVIGSVESTISPEVAVTTGSIGAPPVVQANGVQLDLSWTPVVNATKYDLERSIDQVNFTVIATDLVTTSYTDLSVVSLTPYSYRLVPYNGTVALPRSAWSAGVATGTQPLIPGGFTVVALSATSTYLHWTDTPNAVRHNIYRTTSLIVPFTLLASVASPITEFNDTGLTPNSNYFYYITAVNTDGGESNPSSTLGIYFESTPVNLSSNSSAGKIDLTWSNQPSAASYRVLRSTVSNGPYELLADNITTGTYSDRSVEHLVNYFYVVEGVDSSGYKLPYSNEVSDFTTQVLNLRIPIEMVDRKILSRNVDTSFFRTQTTIDQGAYDGTVTYSFEVIAENADSVQRDVRLIDSSNNTVSVINLPANGVITRLINVANITNPKDIYRIQLEGTSTTSLVTIHQARVVVNQVGATRTRVYFPLIGKSETASHEDFFAPVFANQQANQIFEFSVGSANFIKNSSRYAKIIDTNPWTLEAVVASSPGMTGSVALFNDSEGVEVNKTESLFSVNTPTLIEVPFDETVTGFTSDNENDSYRVALRCDGTCNPGDVALYRAGLWVDLENLRLADIPFRVTSYRSVNDLSSWYAFPDARTFLDLAAFSNPTVFFSAMAALTGGSSVDMKLNSAGTSDDGTLVSNPIANSTLTFTSFQNDTQTSSAITVNPNDRLFPSLEGPGSTATVPETKIWVRISR
jgi:fibronectin type 3 domain-containing protein